MKLCGKCNLTFDGSDSTICPFCGEVVVASPDDGARPDGRRAGESSTLADPRADGQAPVIRCALCKAVFMGRPGDTCPKCGRAVGQKIGLPWQRPKTTFREFFGSIVQTIWQVNRRPTELFADMRTQRGSIEPARYAAAVLWVVFLVFLVELWVADTPFMPEDPPSVWMLAAALKRWGATDYFERLLWAVGDFLGPLVETFGWAGFLCLLALAVLYAAGRIARLVLPAESTTRVPIQDTFAVIAYAVSSASVVLIVPWIGWIAWFVYGLASAIWGIRARHEVTWSMAALAVILGMVGAVIIGAGMALGLLLLALQF